jgi:beta-phosphoglucomutase
MIQNMKGAIFDLDGVIVDTAKYHYLAWQRLAASLGFTFNEKDNERLKGVSRVRSLEILLEVGGILANEDAKLKMAALKNEWYVELIHQLDASELLRGATDYVEHLRSRGIKTAIGSASKNTPLILDRLGIKSLFDAVVDGNMVSKAKPDPEVFLRVGADLKLLPAECVVFEDSEAGIQAALSAGMGAVGIGSPADLKDADVVIGGLWQLLVLV